jgi:hypothetical protein
MEMKNTLVIPPSLVLIIISLTACTLFINLESIIILLLFNLLFVSIIFQLNGQLRLKISLLALGNIIGLLWNIIFKFFVTNCQPFITQTLGQNISTVGYVILFPFLNFLWVVSFWSLSLTFFIKNEVPNVGQQN